VKRELVALAMIVALGAALELCGGCCGTWERAPTTRYTRDALAALDVAALACDGGTTVAYEHHTKFVETNPLLGEHPSELRLWSYLGAIAAGVIVATVKLPPRWALAVDGVVLLVEADAVAYNELALGARGCGLATYGTPNPNTWVR